MAPVLIQWRLLREPVRPLRILNELYGELYHERATGLNMTWHWLTLQLAGYNASNKTSL